MTARLSSRNNRPVFSNGKYTIYSGEDDIDGTRWYFDTDMENNQVIGYANSDAQFPPWGGWMVWCGGGRGYESIDLMPTPSQLQTGPAGVGH